MSTPPTWSPQPPDDRWAAPPAPIQDDTVGGFGLNAPPTAPAPVDPFRVPDHAAPSDGSAPSGPQYPQPQYAAPQYTPPQYAAPQYAAPAYAPSPYDAAPFGAPPAAAPQYAAPQYAAPQNAAPQYAPPLYAAQGYPAGQYAAGQPAADPYGPPVPGADRGLASYNYAYGPGNTYAAQRTSGLAIASLVTSLAAFLFAITAPVGLVLGIVALNGIKRDGTQGRGLAIAGIVVGAVMTVAFVVGAVAFFALFAAIPSDAFTT
ncbi:DUF4190 domain-containing protein [Pengzhenrongella phosphoraccumulans]|uniref:DUF4190 domain-containing protein n=1 Tax=Pengzhenrongella phosphoraccumulans TaxID=3114394 RepID=UPI00388F9E92